jgi:hypothetical protein
VRCLSGSAQISRSRPPKATRILRIGTVRFLKVGARRVDSEKTAETKRVSRYRAWISVPLSLNSRKRRGFRVGIVDRFTCCEVSRCVEEARLPVDPAGTGGIVEAQPALNEGNTRQRGNARDEGKGATARRVGAGLSSASRRKAWRMTGSAGRFAHVFIDSRPSSPLR